MNRQWQEGHETDRGQDPLGADPVLTGILEALDPSVLDPNYWLRFRDWVVRRAGAELARRRLVASLTVGDVLTHWARAVVPTAVLAAAVAGVVLLRGGSSSAQPVVDVEEGLVSGVEGESIPATLSSQEGALAFASETF